MLDLETIASNLRTRSLSSLTLGSISEASIPREFSEGCGSSAMEEFALGAVPGVILDIEGRISSTEGVEVTGALNRMDFPGI